MYPSWIGALAGKSEAGKNWKNKKGLSPYITGLGRLFLDGHWVYWGAEGLRHGSDARVVFSHTGWRAVLLPP
jgi:hypothetical protein